MEMRTATAWIAFFAGLLYGIVIGGLAVARGLGW